VLATHPFAHGRRLTASFGIASLPEDVAPGADDLMRAADEALYAAKRAGKNRVSVFEDVTPAAAPRRGGRAQ
jgi:GGDEF domain-containing protein